MPSGIQGLAEGIMAGIDPGIKLGDRIAALRANNRMQAIQDKLSNGDYSNDAAGQQQLQDDIRAAQAPLTARGLDTSYGSDQLQRVMGLESLRASQQAGGMVDYGSGGSGASGSSGAPNYAPALNFLSQQQAGLGDLGGSMQSANMAGQITAGRNAINNSGQTDLDGTPAGGVNQTQLATGTAANMANFGDNAGAAQWGQQTQQAANASIQGMLGRALTIARNPALGGIQAAVPYVHSAAQLMGYNNVQFSPSQNAISVQDANGNQVALITPGNIDQFAQTIGNDPTQILGNIRTLQSQQYQDLRSAAQGNREQAQKAAYDLAGRAPSDAMLNQAERAATQSQTLAEKTGWKVLHAGQETDANGAPTGSTKMIVQPPGSEPLLLTVSAPDPNNPTQPAFRLQRQDGSDIPAAQLPAFQTQARAMAQAASDQAIFNNLKLNRARFQQGMANIQDVYHQFDPTGGTQAGAPGGAMQTPQDQTPSNLPRGVRNNNPGNLIQSNAPWDGKVPNPTDSQFEQFSSPQAGIQATAQNALRLQANGAKSVFDLINKWAPPNAKGNTPMTTLAYINDVAAKMGVDPEQPINLSDPQTLAKFTNAVIAHENNGFAYSPGTVAQAVAGAVGKSQLASRTNARNQKAGIMAATVPQQPRPRIHIDPNLTNGVANKYLYRG
jgi:hypothetical protein